MIKWIWKRGSIAVLPLVVRSDDDLKYYIVYLSRPSDGYFYVFVDASYCVYHEETNVACAMPWISQ